MNNTPKWINFVAENSWKPRYNSYKQSIHGI